MFNKPKKNKNLSTPNAPSLDEVLSDIKTFQVDIEQKINNKTAESAVNSIDDWWAVFEEFIDDLKCLEMVHSEIEGFKLKLECVKLEIDAESKLLKTEIDQQRKLVDEALE